jgi:thiaminase (transcriptional activator TenA)
MIFSLMTQRLDGLMDKMMRLPFNQKLASGTLEPATYIAYLKQDSLYLQDYTRVLALISSKLNNNEHIAMFLQFAYESVQSEQQLLNQLLERLGATPLNAQDSASSKKNSACFMYTHYLLSTAAYEPVEVAVSSILPCFWIYQQVAKAMQRQQNDLSNPYIDWINLYSGETFAKGVNQCISITNDLATHASLNTQDAMIKAFVTSANLEYQFWQKAYIEHPTNCTQDTVTLE